LTIQSNNIMSTNNISSNTFDSESISESKIFEILQKSQVALQFNQRVDHRKNLAKAWSKVLESDNKSELEVALRMIIEEQVDSNLYFKNEILAMNLDQTFISDCGDFFKHFKVKGKKENEIDPSIEQMLESVLNDKLESHINHLNKKEQLKKIVKQEKYSWAGQVVDDLTSHLSNPQLQDEKFCQKTLNLIEKNKGEGTHNIFKKEIQGIERLLCQYDNIRKTIDLNPENSRSYIETQIKHSSKGKSSFQRGSIHEKQVQKTVKRLLETHFPDISRDNEKLVILENVNIRNLGSVQGKDSRGTKLEIDLIGIYQDQLLFIGESKANPGAIAGDVIKFQKALEMLSQEFSSQGKVTFKGELNGEEVACEIKGNYSFEKLQKRSLYFVPHVGKFVNRYTGKSRSGMLCNRAVVEYAAGKGNLMIAVNQIRTLYQKIEKITEIDQELAQKFPVITIKGMVAESVAKTFVSELMTDVITSCGELGSCHYTDRD
jgi:hypothetical protein